MTSFLLTEFLCGQQISRGITFRLKALLFGAATAWVVGITMVVYSAFAILASRWYVNRLFGVHYRELNLCLQELEEHH